MINCINPKRREFFHDIWKVLADWVWEVDANGVYTHVGEPCSKILGYSPKEIIGKTPFDLMPEDEAKRVGAIFSEIAKTHSPIVNLENWNNTKSGELVCLLTNGIAFFDKNGNFAGYRGIDKDITKTKELEREKLEQQEVLIEGERYISIGRMASGIAHDLSNPLTLLNFGLDAIKKNDVTKDAKPIQDVVALMQNASNTMGSLIKGLKDFYHEQDEATHFKLSDIISSGYISFYLNHLKKLEFDISLSNNAQNDLIYGKQIYMQQILSNVLSNARDALVNSKNPKIEIVTEQTDQKLILRIIDNGPGIAPDKLELVFDSHHTTKAPGKGTGLGLFNVKTLAEKLGANVYFCERDSGAEFLFEAPLILKDTPPS